MFTCDLINPKIILVTVFKAIIYYVGAMTFYFLYTHVIILCFPATINSHTIEVALIEIGRIEEKVEVM